MLGEVLFIFLRWTNRLIRSVCSHSGIEKLQRKNWREKGLQQQGDLYFISMLGESYVSELQGAPGRWNPVSGIWAWR